MMKVLKKKLFGNDNIASQEVDKLAALQELAMPVEIWKHIMLFCDDETLLTLFLVSKKMRELVTEYLQKNYKDTLMNDIDQSVGEQIQYKNKEFKSTIKDVKFIIHPQRKQQWINFIACEFSDVHIRDAPESENNFRHVGFDQCDLKKVSFGGIRANEIFIKDNCTIDNETSENLAKVEEALRDPHFRDPQVAQQNIRSAFSLGNVFKHVIVPMADVPAAVLSAHLIRVASSNKYIESYPYLFYSDTTVAWFLLMFLSKHIEQGTLRSFLDNHSLKRNCMTIALHVTLLAIMVLVCNITNAYYPETATDRTDMDYYPAAIPGLLLTFLRGGCGLIDCLLTLLDDPNEEQEELSSRQKFLMQVLSTLRKMANLFILSAGGLMFLPVSTQRFIINNSKVDFFPFIMPIKVGLDLMQLSHWSSHQVKEYFFGLEESRSGYSLLDRSDNTSLVKKVKQVGRHYVAPQAITFGLLFALSQIQIFMPLWNIQDDRLDKENFFKFMCFMVLFAMLVPTFLRRISNLVNYSAGERQTFFSHPRRYDGNNGNNAPQIFVRTPRSRAT